MESITRLFFSRILRNTSFSMIFFIFTFLTLPPMVFAILDRNCTTMTAIGKYTTNAVNCDNVYSDAACNTIYGAGVTVDGTTERPLLCFMLNGEKNDEMKQIAIATCPKTCGYCCQTDAYNCFNAPYPRITCSQVTARQCRDRQWREILTEDCPNVCGFCTEGGCADKAIDCYSDLSICLNVDMQDWVQENCRKTCGLCRPSVTTTGSITRGTDSDCLDYSTNCASWSYRGLCESPFYSYEYKFRNCAATCQLC